MLGRWSWYQPSVLLLGLALLLAGGAQAQETCSHLEGWKPSPEQLQGILQDHAKWLEARGDPAAPGRAILCNAELTGTRFNKANLQKANLEDANLQEAFLVDANLQEAQLVRASLQGANLWRANLQGADLVSTKLQKANLGGANLQEANLVGANLQGASLWGANLQKAHLGAANLQGANLEGAANLQEANLMNANLQEARLVGTDLEGARLSNARLHGAWYEPATAPAPGYLTGLQGLATLRFRPGANSGAVLLRTRLAEVGLHNLEREVTYAIEHNATRHLLHDAHLVEGVFRLIFFEAPVGYGLHPGRALWILVSFIGIFALIYLGPLSSDGLSGIYRIWPKGRLAPTWRQLAQQMAWEEELKVERLRPHGERQQLAAALQFSVLTAFHLGWRDLNVGTWLSRLQQREYALQATGWVRVVAGIQALVSVYLLALWVLTYFGRPFG